MRGMLLRTAENTSKYGGIFYYAFFKMDDGRSMKSCLTPKCKNFENWKNLIGKENILLDGLNVKGSVVDADSIPKEVNNKNKGDAL